MPLSKPNALIWWSTSQWNAKQGTRSRTSRSAKPCSEHFRCRAASACTYGWQMRSSGSSADSARTARFLIMAGERALQALAFEDALRHLETARTLLADVDNSGQARVLRLKALALRGMGRTDEALAAFGQALPLAPAGPERDGILYARAELHLDPLGMIIRGGHGS